jgi:DNA anti-recombination protein RmuC
MEMDVLAAKLDDMNKRCTERMDQLEKNLTLAIESQNRLFTERMNHIEQTASKAHSRLDEQKRSILCLKAWKNRQIGALIILSIIVTYIAEHIK